MDTEDGSGVPWHNSVHGLSNQTVQFTPLTIENSYSLQIDDLKYLCHLIFYIDCDVTLTHWPTALPPPPSLFHEIEDEAGRTNPKNPKEVQGVGGQTDSQEDTAVPESAVPESDTPGQTSGSGEIWRGQQLPSYFDDDEELETVEQFCEGGHWQKHDRQLQDCQTENGMADDRLTHMWN